MKLKTCHGCEGSGYADYAAVPCENCLGTGVEPYVRRYKPKWPWDHYLSFWAWLRHGILIRWRCADCGKRHLSGVRYWDKHIYFDVPLCSKCQDETFEGYNEAQREFQEKYAHLPVKFPFDEEDQAIVDRYQADLEQTEF